MTLREHRAVIDDLRRRGKVAAVAAGERLDVIVSRAETIATAVTAYETGSAALVAVPYVEVRTTVRAIEEFVLTYYEDVDYEADLFVQLRALAQQLFSLSMLRHVFASQATLTGAVTNVFVPSDAPLTPYRLRQGDTLERIALETMADVGRVQDIIDLNDLVYPFVLTDRDYVVGDFTPEFDPYGFRVGLTVDRTNVPPGVLVTGEVIYLPSDARVPRAAQLTDRDVELWGRDLALDGDGFLAIDANGELQTVAGVDNIRQALAQCIRVVRGELVLHPDYGIERLLAVGIEGTEQNALFSGLEVARTVRRDPRVTGVRNINVSLLDTTNAASMTVGLIGASQATIPLNLVLPESVLVTAG